MPRLLQIAQLGHPVLRKVAEPVLAIDDEIQSLIEDLFATSAEANGAGIAAPQVYVSLRVFILSIKPSPRYPHAPDMESIAVINPEILSVPRPKQIKVRYQTREGTSVEREFSGFAARVFLHEFDHLQGLTWLDHVEDNRDIVSEKEYLKTF